MGIREAARALADRGLSVSQASIELGLSSRNLAHYYAGVGAFRGQLMAGAREWLEGLPPREAVGYACDLIEAMTEPPGEEPLEPWPGVRLPNMRFARLLRFLDRRRQAGGEYAVAHWMQLRAAVHADLIDWQAADWKEIHGYCRRLHRILAFEPCNLNTRKADLVPLARPWGRIVWREKRARLVLAPGVPAPWAVETGAWT
jgi:hypothetical protein